MMSSKQQHHIPYFFRTQQLRRPGRRSLFLSQLASGTAPMDTLRRNQLNLDIASHDLPLAHLRELQEDLEINNILGRMVTFDVVTQTWVDWQR
jgi:hypothetical protein